jgi:hypothetical protein
MCKEMLVILVNRVVDTKRTIGKNLGLRRRRCTAQGKGHKPIFIKTNKYKNRFNFESVNYGPNCFIKSV